jgi:hypothetical protein
VHNTFVVKLDQRVARKYGATGEKFLCDDKDSFSTDFILNGLQSQATKY